MFGKKRLKSIINQQEKVIQRQDKTLSHFNKQMMINHGNALLSVSLNNGELFESFGKEVAWCDNYSNEELYNMLMKAKAYLDRSSEINASYIDLTEREIEQNRPLSYRQISRALATITLIHQNNLNEAMHELQDCILNYHYIDELKKITISVNEFTIYNCLIDTFIHQIEDQKENT